MDGQQQGSAASGSSLLVAAVLGVIACPGVDATTGAPAPRGEAAAESPPLDCEAEHERLRQEIAEALLTRGFEDLPEHLRRRMNPFHPSPCGSLFDDASDSVVFTEAHAQSSDQSAIHALWSGIDATWNARDAKGFSRYFAEDARFTFMWSGESLEGRAEILEHFSGRFARLAPDLRHRTRIRAIGSLGPGVFTASGNVEILRVAAADEEAPEVAREYAVFTVMAGEDESWRVRTLRVYQWPPAGGDEAG